MSKTPPISTIIIPQKRNFVNYSGLFLGLCYDKNMIKKLLLPLFALAILGTTLISTPAFADCRYLLGAPSWDCGMEEITDQDTLKQSFPIIASNVLNIISVVASYLVIGYIIYGGYLYIFSDGDTSKLATGKKALNQAFIGLAITMSAAVIFGGIRAALVGDNQLTPDGANATLIVQNLINWVIGVAGVIALVFVVGGGIMYTTSAGDPTKLTKAKNMILFSLIGLIIVALSLVISNFMATTINSANETQSYQVINNLKELHEKKLS